ncbi:MAG: DUF6809 family protein [Oscillospiraceae bacterium]|jgi:hypothetical protein
MDEILKALYDSFYAPPEMMELKQEADDNHRILIERLEKPERKLVLRIIDAKDSIAGQLSLDSFICGFKLAWKLTNELNHYNDNRRSTPAGRPELDACSVFREVESE